MAATASAYPNSDARKSGNKCEFPAKEIAALLASVDFSVRREAVLYNSKQGRIRGTRRYRRDYLRSALLHMWKAAGSPGGNEVLLFCEVSTFAEAAGRCERAMRYILRELDGTNDKNFRVIEQIKKANTIRRPATYRLDVHALRRYCRRGPQSIASLPSSPPAQEPAVSSTPIAATAAPVPVAVPAPELPRESHRSSSRKTRQLTSREGAKLVQKMVELMRGCEGHTEVGGYYVDYLRDPENPDPRYRAPMTRDKALIAACMQFCIPEDSAREALKLAGWKLEDPEASS
jgi:hypothetical protein